MGPVTKRFGEPRAIYFSLVVGLMSFLILAFATNGTTIYLGIVVGCLSGFAFPAMQSLMTKATPEDAQGELQGAIMSLYSLAAIISPLVMAKIFTAYTDTSGLYMPGAPFILAAGLILLSGATFFFAMRMKKLD